MVGGGGVVYLSVDIFKNYIVLINYVLIFYCVRLYVYMRGIVVIFNKIFLINGKNDWELLRLEIFEF